MTEVRRYPRDWVGGGSINRPMIRLVDERDANARWWEGFVVGWGLGIVAAIVVFVAI